MANTAKPAPGFKVHGGVPAGNKMPLESYINQMSTPGMTPAETKSAAHLVQTGALHGAVKK